MCLGRLRTTPIARPADRRSSRLHRINRRRHNMQLRKAIRGVARKATRHMGEVRKATTPIAAATLTTTLARGRGPQGRRPGRRRDTRITQRRPTRLLRDMDRLARQVATQEETAAEGIRQLRATARVAAMDRPRRTLPAATALQVPIRRRAPRAVAVPTRRRAPRVVAVAVAAAIAAEVEAVEAGVAMLPVVGVVADTAEAAAIDNDV